MSNVNKNDYEEIVKIFNGSGAKAAKEYITLHHGVKYPRDVLTRIKKSSGYSYDAVNKKIIASKDLAVKSIFMGIDELCKPTASMNPPTTAAASISNNKDFSIEILYQELMQEKLIELTKYVTLSRHSNTISIDKTALIADGYEVAIH